jgi:predicted nucleic acid-binding protein
MDDEICRQNTKLLQLDTVKNHYSPELQRARDKRRTQLEANVLELEQEKRKEYLECWRDLMFMKKYLLTSLKDYWDLAKKRNLLSYDVSHLSQNETGKGY